MTADEALAIIDRDYDIGAGGGQLSTLIHDVMKLRALGFKPSNANKEAIDEGPGPPTEPGPADPGFAGDAAYQRKMQAQAQNANNPSQPGFSIGGPPPGMGAPVAPGVPANPGASPGVGLLLPSASLPSWSTKNC